MSLKLRATILATTTLVLFLVAGLLPVLVSGWLIETIVIILTVLSFFLFVRTLLKATEKNE